MYFLNKNTALPNQDGYESCALHGILTSFLSFHELISIRNLSALKALRAMRGPKSSFPIDMGF